MASSDPSEQSNCWSHFLLASIHCPFLHWNWLGWQRFAVAEWEVKERNVQCKKGENRKFGYKMYKILSRGFMILLIKSIKSIAIIVLVSLKIKLY